MVNRIPVSGGENLPKLNIPKADASVPKEKPMVPANTVEKITGKKENNPAYDSYQRGQLKIHFDFKKPTEAINLTLKNLQTIYKSYMDPLAGQGVLTSGYGQRENPMGGGDTDFHYGIDLGAALGTPIYAAKEGKVIAIEQRVKGKSAAHSRGNYVVLEHNDGTKTHYFHMRYFGKKKLPQELRLKVGETVTRGQKIGEVGKTGRTTGAHLHFEIEDDQKYFFDPLEKFTTETKSKLEKSHQEHLERQKAKRSSSKKNIRRHHSSHHHIS